MSPADRDLVPERHPRRAELDALVAELEALPGEAWTTTDPPAIVAPPEIVEAPAGERDLGRRPRWRPRLLAGLATAAAAVVVAVVALGGPTTSEPRTESRLAAVGDSGSSGVVSVDGDRVRVRVRDMAPVRDGARYEAWSLADPGRPVSLGTMRPAADGTASVEASTDGAPGAVAVTLEPDDGDPAPSGDFVLRTG